MRLSALLFTAILLAAPALGQPAAPSPAQDGTPKEGQSAKSPDTRDQSKPDQAKDDASQGQGLPVSLDRIKEQLQQHPLLSLSTAEDRPTFRVQIQERRKIEELIASLDFKAGPTPAGGVYMAEQNRIMFPSVDNPLVQPYAAFNQGELLTILVENLVGKYLAGRAMNSISRAERARAEAAAREEVHSAIEEYCSAQPGGGAGLAICTSPGR